MSLEHARAALDSSTPPAPLPRHPAVELGEHVGALGGVRGDSIDLRTIGGERALMLTVWDADVCLSASIVLDARGVAALEALVAGVLTEWE